MHTDTNLRVGIHQPYFFPPLSYFAKMKASYAFWFLDDVQFVDSGRSHLANRCKLGDNRWLSIPIHKHNGQKINEAKVVDHAWMESLCNRIRYDYRKAPFTQYVLAFLKDNHVELENVSELNIHWIRKIAEIFDINTWLLISSFHLKQPVLDRDERLAVMTKFVGGKSYLSGPKGPEYMRPEVYENIKVEVIRYTPKEYTRGDRPFVPYLSILDYLCYHWTAQEGLFDSNIVRWDKNATST